MAFDLTGFPHGTPCTEEDFARAEERLGHTLPGELKRIYMAANGFRGPTHAAFLYPLVRTEPFDSTTAVDFALQLRSDPDAPSFWARAIPFGDYGVGATWGIDLESGTVFEWWPEDGEARTGLGSSISEVWSQKRRWFESLPKRPGT